MRPVLLYFFDLQMRKWRLEEATLSAFLGSVWRQGLGRLLPGQNLPLCRLEYVVNEQGTEAQEACSRVLGENVKHLKLKREGVAWAFKLRPG